ncbi:MAG: alpha/beta fold hydrolase, partial [Phycisphaerales bacterium]
MFLTLALVAGFHTRRTARCANDHADGSGRETLPQQAQLFEPAEPYQSGYLDVSDLHSIHYALCGNPAGKTVFVLHGGPGFGCYPRLTQYFDPAKFRIVLHDQRGAGQSRPAGELRENTTWHLVEDIERLRRHLKIEDKILIFGGSWGSTLALAYAEKHPDRVAGMALRGIWTGTRTELDNTFGNLTQHFFPDALERITTAMPTGKDFTPQTLNAVFTGDDAAVQQETVTAWIQYGVKIGKLHA